MAVTLRDVARSAGVSVATASRALNGTGGRAVSPEKQALVGKAAAQLNYRPPEANARLDGAIAEPARRTNNIGLLLRATYRITDPFWSQVLEGSTEEILRQGYHIGFAYIVDDLTHHRRRRLVNERYIDGLVLMGDMGLVDEIVDLAPTKNIVVIAGSDTGRWESDVRFDVITMEKYAAMDRLVEHLVAHGRPRLGFLGPSAQTDRRGDGFIYALLRRGLPYNADLFAETGFSTEAGYTAARELLTEHAAEMDGLVCACDTLAIGAIRAAKECGLHLPADLAITGFDNIPFARDLDPPLTTVHVPKEFMGELAVRRLIERIQHPEWPPIIQMAPTSLVVRTSCGELLTN